MKTYIIRRLLDQGFLGAMSVYASVAHTDDVLDQYFDALAIVFGELATTSDSDIALRLPQGTAHGGFARLT